MRIKHIPLVSTMATKSSKSEALIRLVQRNSHYSFIYLSRCPGWESRERGGSGGKGRGIHSFHIPAQNDPCQFRFSRTTRRQFNRVAICRAWYNGVYTMTAKPIKTMEIHYPIIQFLIKTYIGPKVVETVLELWKEVSGYKLTSPSFAFFFFNANL